MLGRLAPARMLAASNGTNVARIRRPVGLVLDGVIESSEEKPERGEPMLFPSCASGAPSLRGRLRGCRDDSVTVSGSGRAFHDLGLAAPAVA
jgi:hypothetical protein